MTNPVYSQLDAKVSAGPRPAPVQSRSQLSEGEYRQPWDVFKNSADREVKMAAAQTDGTSAAVGTTQEE